MTQEKLRILRDKANKLPLLPGVYLMKDNREEVIYVGKAKALKNRVSSYFHGSHLPKVAAMVDKVADFDVIVASTEFEALVLENSLIKRHQPHYNILLRDDKGYPFVRMDRSEWPRFSLTNRIADDGARYFGPFCGRSQTFEILDTLAKMLKLPTCGRKFPRDRGKDRPCLNHHMGVCCGWCQTDTTKEDYQHRIEQAVMILEGRSKELLRDLEHRMQEAAEELRFEQAAELRDRLRALSALDQKQRVIAAVYADTDVLGFVRGAKSCFSVLHYTDGDLAGKDYNLLDEPLEDDAEAVSDFLRQYYADRGAWPKVILLPLEPEDREMLERFISEQAGHKVRLEIPRRGERRRLIEAAERNAGEEILRVTTSAQRRQKTLEWLQKALALNELPQRMEAFDVSNTGDFGVVASMTVFVGGRPLKRDYRKFRVKENHGQDDYGAMREVLLRRFRRYLDGDAAFGTLPQLLLIDGGSAHARVARQVLQELELTIPVFGMVKDDRHRTRALAAPDDREIGLDSNPAAFALIGTIQEETHRFAIEYHRSLRKELIGSALDDIPGVGEKRRKALLQHFGSVKAMREVTEEELAAVVPKNVARAVWIHFHGEKTKEENSCES
ncbi:MAG: excinuclease ABC subunit UvrC [Eubacteriales bacterium]|nr:excinuclease ABC subunit UvrC [Eubacteriales bacterium]